MPASTSEREPTTNIRNSDVVISIGQMTSGTVRVGALPANATLITAKMPTQASASITIMTASNNTSGSLAIDPGL